MGKPIDLWHKRNTDQWASTKHLMEDFSQHNSSFIGHKNQAKFENDWLSRNGHRIKITQPNLMILVSFSCAEDSLFNNVKKYNTFSSQSTDNPPFLVFGTPGIVTEGCLVACSWLWAMHSMFKFYNTTGVTDWRCVSTFTFGLRFTKVCQCMIIIFMELTYQFFFYILSRNPGKV